MKIELTTTLRAGIIEGEHDAARRDVRVLKRVLICTGFYTPDPAQGVTGEMDESFLRSLEAFRRAHMIPFNDPVGPGSVTERVMNTAMARLESEGRFYIWRTVGDARVREEHGPRAGRRFQFNAPPEDGHPGEAYGCRCWAEPLAPSRHPMAVEAREGAERSYKQQPSSGAYGMALPQKSLPPEFQESSAATLLWNGASISVAACWGNQACRAWMIREGTAIILENGHHLPPDNLPAFPDAKQSRRKGERKRWIGADGKIYEWDSRHGEIEVYDKTGKKHLGGFDHKTGKQLSKPVPGRKIQK